MEFDENFDFGRLFSLDGLVGGMPSTQYLPDFDRDLYLFDAQQLLLKSPKFEHLEGSGESSDSSSIFLEEEQENEAENAKSSSNATVSSLHEKAVLSSNEAPKGGLSDYAARNEYTHGRITSWLTFASRIRMINSRLRRSPDYSLEEYSSGYYDAKRISVLRHKRFARWYLYRSFSKRRNSARKLLLAPAVRPPLLATPSQRIKPPVPSSYPYIPLTLSSADSTSVELAHAQQSYECSAKETNLSVKGSNSIQHKVAASSPGIEDETLKIFPSSSSSGADVSMKRTQEAVCVRKNSKVSEKVHVEKSKKRQNFPIARSTLSSSLSHALRKTMQHAESNLQFMMAEISTTQIKVQIPPHDGRNVIFEAISPDMTVSEVIEKIVTKQFAIGRLPSPNPKLYELRILDDDFIPDMDLGALELKRKFAKFNLEEVALCYLKEDAGLRPIVETRENRDLSTIHEGSSSLPYYSESISPPCESLRSQATPRSSSSFIWNKPLSKMGEKANAMGMSGLVGESEDLAVFRPFLAEKSLPNAENKESSLSQKGMQRDDRLLEVASAHPSLPSSRWRMGVSSSRIAQESDYLSDFDYSISEDEDAFLQETEEAAGRVGKEGKIPLAEYSDQRYGVNTPSPASSKVSFQKQQEDDSRAGPTVASMHFQATKQALSRPVGLSSIQLHRCASVHVPRNTERVFTIVTERIANKRFSDSNQKKDFSISPRNQFKPEDSLGVDKEVVVVTLAEDSRIFELCARVAKLMGTDNPACLAFKTLNNEIHLDMGALVKSIPHDEHTLVIYRHTYSKARRSSFSDDTANETRPSLDMFVFTEYTASIVSEYRVNFRIVNLIEESPHLIKPQSKAILTIDGQRIYHQFPSFPGSLNEGSDSLNSFTPNYNDMSVNAKSKTIRKSENEGASLGWNEINFEKPNSRNYFLSGFNNKSFANLYSNSRLLASKEHHSGNFSSDKMRLSYPLIDRIASFGNVVSLSATAVRFLTPPKVQRIQELTFVDLHLGDQKSFYLGSIGNYTATQRSTDGLADLVVLYTAESPVLCAEIVAKLKFLMDLYLSRIGAASTQGRTL